MSTGQEFIQWAVGQGVAVAVLVFVMVRLETRMATLQSSIDKLTAYLQGEHDARLRGGA